MYARPWVGPGVGIDTELQLVSALEGAPTLGCGPAMFISVQPERYV